MNSTLRLLIVALAMLSAFLIGASTSGPWAGIGIAAGGKWSFVVNTRTGQVCRVVIERNGPSTRLCEQ